MDAAGCRPRPAYALRRHDRPDATAAHLEVLGPAGGDPEITAAMTTLLAVVAEYGDSR
ncbi:hypothetical protein IMZ11_27515 [Microtetraspora sp. AC03309]|uniref:hypothetical protein n=1 Tax=Microtetraspora sp. AC03309 TaxID=2779376 RepID=UPI001E4F197E|nr:hypothetical protein [Microtetraspora sp. AC03309]MCC5579385.1 hypothetical protein [Microtetraspora sp. AC03309]